MLGERKAAELLPEQKNCHTLIPELLALPYSTRCLKGFLKVNLLAADSIIPLSNISAQLFPTLLFRAGLAHWPRCVLVE